MAPGTAAEALAVLVMVRAGVRTVTVLVHRASALPDAQLLPAVVEVTVLVMVWLPVSGLLTVTE